MLRSLALALALIALLVGDRVASAQAPPQCNDFLKLRGEAEQKGMAVRKAGERKAERKEICGLVSGFYTAEAAIVKFLENNKTWCGIPDEAVKTAKVNHEKTAKFRTVVCSDAPTAKPKQPTLSDAIATPSVDSAGNTKTGRGTLDTLNGNPLAK
ncbi:MAG: hypothetical protein WBF03_16275 [Xanthobacteraceae bacterium]|jgi:hypothetical protein